MTLLGSESNSIFLDVEFGNADSFYSAKKTATLPYDSTQFIENNLYHYEWAGRLNRTNIKLEDKICESGKVLVRKLVFHFNAQSFLFDMVSRFVIFSNNKRPASIANLLVEHKCSNLYYQFSADHPLKVPVRDNQYLVFSTLNCIVPSGFKEVFYVRDEAVSDGKYKWIVHHRLIVDPAKAKLIVRGCHPKIEGILPCQNLFPECLKRYLFRIRERKYPGFPIMSVGEIEVAKGDCAQMSTRIELT